MAEPQGDIPENLQADPQGDPQADPPADIENPHDNNHNVTVDIYVGGLPNTAHDDTFSAFCWPRHPIRCFVLYIVIAILLLSAGFSFGMGYSLFDKGAKSDVCLRENDGNVDACSDQFTTEDSAITATIAQFVAITPGLLAIVKWLADSDILIEGLFLDMSNFKKIRNESNKTVANMKQVARALSYASRGELAVILIYGIFAFCVYVITLIEILTVDHTNEYVKNSLISSGASIGGIAFLTLGAKLITHIYNSIKPVGSEAAPLLAGE